MPFCYRLSARSLRFVLRCSKVHTFRYHDSCYINAIRVQAARTAAGSSETHLQQFGDMLATINVMPLNLAPPQHQVGPHVMQLVAQGNERPNVVA